MPTGIQTDLKQSFLSLVARRLFANPRCYFIGFSVSRHRLEVTGAGNRICDMPIAEESILGIATGMSRVGAEVFVDLMFEAFIFRTMDVLVNQMALSKLLPPEGCGPVTVRVLSGPFIGAGPQHGGTNYALLTRLPNVLVCAPSVNDDVRSAYAVAQDLHKTLLLLMTDGMGDETATLRSAGPSQMRICGVGRKLSIICFGIHASAVRQAVVASGVMSQVRIIVPLFIAPFPLESLLDEAGAARSLLILDGPSPPDTIGDHLALMATHRGTWNNVVHHSLWNQASETAFNPDIVVRSLTKVISKMTEETGSLGPEARFE